MKIAILARQAGTNHSINRLQEAGSALGHNMRVWDVNQFSLAILQGSIQLTYQGQPLPDIDAVIPRIGASLNQFSAAVLQHLELMGVFVLNPVNSILATVDKFRCLQTLATQEVPVPDTAFAASNFTQTIDTLGGAPLVLKLLKGTQGIGVMLTETKAATQSVIETLHSLDQYLIMQRFVGESRGQDLRAFVVGNKVVAAMHRKAKGEEFRSNLHRGSSAQFIELEESYKETAVRATQALGLRVTGVDMLLSNDGPKVIEVNASPGLQGIEQSSNIDIATIILQYIPQAMQRSKRLNS